MRLRSEIRHSAAIHKEVCLNCRNLLKQPAQAMGNAASCSSISLLGCLRPCTARLVMFGDHLRGQLVCLWCAAELDVVGFERYEETEKACRGSGIPNLQLVIGNVSVAGS